MTDALTKAMTDAVAAVLRKRAAALRAEAAIGIADVEKVIESGARVTATIVTPEARMKLRGAVLYEACARDVEAIAGEVGS